MSKNDSETDGYGIAYLSKELDMDPANVRNALRRLKVEKTDNRYSWSRKSEADAVVKRVRDSQRAPKAEKAEKGEKAEKTSAKGSKVNKDAADRSKAAAKAAKAEKAERKPAKGDKKAKKDADEE